MSNIVSASYLFSTIMMTTKMVTFEYLLTEAFHLHCFWFSKQQSLISLISRLQTSAKTNIMGKLIAQNRTIPHANTNEQ